MGGRAGIADASPLTGVSRNQTRPDLKILSTLFNSHQTTFSAISVFRYFARPSTSSTRSGSSITFLQRKSNTCNEGGVPESPDQLLDSPNLRKHRHQNIPILSHPIFPPAHDPLLLDPCAILAPHLSALPLQFRLGFHPPKRMHVIGINIPLNVSSYIFKHIYSRQNAVPNAVKTTE